MIEYVSNLYPILHTFLRSREQKAVLLTPKSLHRIKVLLFTLIRNFEFTLALPVDEIEDSSLIVTRPCVKSEPRAGAQMPLLVKKCRK